MQKTGLFFLSVFLIAGSILTRGQIDQEGYCRQEIHFQSGKFQIVGDLHIPSQNKRYPAIIFVHGDGPAKRGSFRLMRQIINCFLEVGFACLFYDKPGYGSSEGKFSKDQLFYERASILVDAVGFLKKHPFINPKLIGIRGISQAGYVMPMALSMTKDIAFMIAVSCPARNGIEQSAYLVEKQMLCEEYEKEEAEKAKRYYIQRANAKTYEEYLEAAEYLDENPFIQSINWGGIKPRDQFSPRDPKSESFFTPISIIEKITIPVLAIFGDKDTQIDPFIGAQSYERALKKAGNPFYQVELFPNANHGIMVAETGCIKEPRERYLAGKSSLYAPGYLKLNRDWLKRLMEHMDKI